MARRRFFVDSVRGDAAELTGEEARHLARVLRAEPGQVYEICDNRTAYLAEIRETGRDRVVFRVLEPLAPRTPPVAATVYVALVKFERFEWLVEKATELGAAEIVPFEAQRSEKGLAQAAEKRVERWRRIARESSQQARRDQMPEVSAPVLWEACLADPAVWRFFLEESGAVPLSAAVPPAGVRRTGDRVALLAGPEGGWTEAERTAAAAAGWRAVSLGPQVLRTETAVVAALSVLENTWWVASS